MRRANWIFSFLFFLSSCFYSFAQDVNFESSNLPIIVIDTNGKTIVNEPKIMAQMGIIDNGDLRNNLTDPHNGYDGYIGIEIRGSSSTMFLKKSYAVETRMIDGSNRNVSLLGLPEENDWVLYGPYSDKTLLRNVIVFSLVQKMGHYSSRFRFCEVVINGDYRGIYVLLEKVKRDKNRVDISKLQSTEISGDDLTGGYIIKIDKTDGAQVDGWISPYKATNNNDGTIYYQYHYPSPDDIVDEQKTYIEYYITSFENMMHSHHYADQQIGYPAWIDEESFIDYFLVNEFTKNVDAYRLSAFMYKDKDSDNPLIHMGPFWDYNLGFGNADYYNGASTTSWVLDYNFNYDSFGIPFWWHTLFNDESFFNKICLRWADLRSNFLTVDSINAFIDQQVRYLDEARKRNFERWPVIGTYVWPNPYIGQTYEDEIAHLKTWIKARFEWMDSKLVVTTSVEKPVQPAIKSFELSGVYPNPMNNSATIDFQLKEQSFIELTLWNENGKKIKVLKADTFSPGVHHVHVDFSGLASGIYFISAGNKETLFKEAKRLILLK